MTSADSTTAPSRTSHADGSLSQTLARLWPIFVLSWLVFIIIGPVAAMLSAAEPPFETLSVLAWAVTFTGAYLWLTLRQPFRTVVTTSERWRQAGLLALLTGLIVYVDLVNEPGYFWVFIGVIVPAGAVLPTRVAAIVVAGLTAIAIGIEVTRTGGEAAMQVPGIAIWGICTIMLRCLVLTVAELRAAREELAHLAVTRERLRFARDLHDLLGHSLSLITLKSELARRLAQTRSERATAEMADVEQVARRALREVREAVAGYRQPALDDELASVRAMLAAAGIEARIDADVDALPATVDAVLAWTVREGVTNVVRHSGARHCEIRIWRDRETVRATISDDGCGASAGSPGSGLSGVAERVAAAGGWLATGAGDGDGFSLQVIIPVPMGTALEPTARMPAGEVAP